MLEEAKDIQLRWVRRILCEAGAVVKGISVSHYLDRTGRRIGTIRSLLT